jgi:hypothetical protein
MPGTGAYLSESPALQPVTFLVPIDGPVVRREFYVTGERFAATRLVICSPRIPLGRLVALADSPRRILFFPFLW